MTKNILTISIWVNRMFKTSVGLFLAWKNFFAKKRLASSCQLSPVSVKVLTTTPSESSHVVCVFVHDVIRFFGFADSPVLSGPVNRVSPIVLIVCYSALVFSWRQSVYSSTPVFEQTVIDQNLRTTFNFLQKIKKLLIFRVRYFKPIWIQFQQHENLLTSKKSRESQALVKLVYQLLIPDFTGDQLLIQ